MDKEIRKSVIAGTWYPGDPSTLTGEIRSYLQKVPEQTVGGPVVGLVSPHAGYAYSGQIAAYGYRLVEGRRYDAVVVIGPSHRVLFHGASVWPWGGYETPLGVVPIDSELAEAILGADPVLNSDRKPHAAEHSVEIQLPFLQVVLGTFAFVPIVMGSQDYQTCEAVADAIFQGGKREKRARRGKLRPLALPHLREGEAPRPGGRRPRAEAGLPGAFARARGRDLRGLRRGSRR